MGTDTGLPTGFSLKSLNNYDKVFNNNIDYKKHEPVALFRGWWDGGDKKQATTIKNEHARSISRVVTKNYQPHCQK